jgi:Flp pilus assembly protein TadG
MEPREQQGIQERGQSIVELAAVVPILLLILLGAIDLGRAFYAYVSISNAARVGAEFAMEPLRTQTEIRSIIKAETAPRINLSDSDITLTTPGWVKGNDLTVEVRTPFTAVTPLISSFWGGGSLTMRARSTIRFD